MAVASAGEPALDERIMLCLQATVTSFSEQESKAFKRLTKAKAPRWPDLKTQTAAREHHQQQLILQQAQLRITDASVCISADSEGLEGDSECDPESSAAGVGQCPEGDAGVLENCHDLSIQEEGKEEHGAGLWQERHGGSTAIAMRELEAPTILPNVQPGILDGEQKIGVLEDSIKQPNNSIPPAEIAGDSPATEPASAVTEEPSTSASTNSGNSASTSSGASSSSSSSSPSSSTQQAGPSHDEGSSSHAGLGETDGDTGVGSTPLSSQEMRQLACRVDLRIAINVPAPLNVVPSPLLSYAGVTGCLLSPLIGDLCRAWHGMALLFSIPDTSQDNTNSCSES